MVNIGVSDELLKKDLAENFPEVSNWHLGNEWLSSLDEYDVIIRSPGISLLKLPESCLSRTTSGTRILVDKHRDRIWAVTGTKGKSTTATLLSHIFKDQGFNFDFGGNIGVPPLDLYDSSSDIILLELSSYQLDGLRISPRVGIFLNLYEEHLDYHGGFSSYVNAKTNIFRFQKSSGDMIILPDPGLGLAKGLDATNSMKEGLGARFYYGQEDEINTGAFLLGDKIILRSDNGRELVSVLFSDIFLKGSGNYFNICAVLSALYHGSRLGLFSLEIDWEKVSQTIRNFRPLKHRLEEVTTSSQIVFVNDSISTVPESTLQAISAYVGAIDTLILGGFDRGVSFDHLASRLLETDIRAFFFIPPSGRRLREIMEEKLKLSGKKESGEMQLVDVSNLEEAVRLAKELTRPGRVCMLSPASPSFPLFRNFEERGELFRKLCSSLINLNLI